MLRCGSGPGVGWEEEEYVRGQGGTREHAWPRGSLARGHAGRDGTEGASPPRVACPPGTVIALRRRGVGAGIMSGALGFTHRWVEGPPGASRTLLLLHGTGGDENDLLPLGRQLAPDANLLSPRGKVLEHGMPRFFRRVAEGVLDVPDLRARAAELADFVAEASKRHAFDARRVVAVGYSNGANVAIGMLYERPEALAGAVLIRAMSPYEPERAPDLAGKRVLVLAGERDPYSRRDVTERLAAILRSGGAYVEARYAQAGHELSPSDVAAARAWLEAGR